MSFCQTSSLSKPKQSDLPEKDLSYAQNNFHTINNTGLNYIGGQPNTPNLQSTMMANHRQLRAQNEFIQQNNFLSSLPETNRLMSQSNMQQTPYSMPHNYNHLYQPQFSSNQAYFNNNERLISSMNHMNLTEKLYNPSMSTIMSHHSSNSVPLTSTPMNSTETTNDSIIRRDNEIDRLRMRILMLEQQMQTGSSASSSSMITSAKQEANNVEIRLKNFQLEAALMRDQLNKFSSTKVADLESLLNQREYEIQELKLNFSDESSRLERELSKFKGMLNTKEEELINERTKSSSYQKEIEKLRSKIAECNKYISELPTKDEVVQAEKQISDVQSENQTLRQKINDCEKRVIKAKSFIKEKNVEVSDLKDKVEKAEMDKEKVKLEFENYKKETQSVGELLEKCEQNAKLRAELECAKKFVSSLQDKLKNQEVRHQEVVEEFEDKLRLEVDLSQSLRSDLENKDSLLKDMETSIKDCLRQNQGLMNENLSLKDKIKAFETVLSADSLKLLKLMFKELNNSTFDLDLLVTNCVDIYHGKSIDICSLLGTANQNSYEYLDLGSSDTIMSLINSDFLQKKISELKEMRKKIEEIKKMITDSYAEKIGDNTSCITQ